MLIRQVKIMTELPNILFTYQFEKELIKEIQDKVNVIQGNEHDGSFLNKIDLDTIDGLVCNNPFNLLDVASMQNLKWIQLTSSGIDRLPSNISEGITVTNAKNPYSVPISEYVIGKILEVYKNSKYYYNNQDERIWGKNYSSLSLYRKKVGILGTGSIGAEVAKRLGAFGCDIYGFNTSGNHKKPFTQIQPITKLEKLLSLLDILIVAMPHTPHTENFLTAELFELMKNNSVLINVSRGAVINEEDLLIELEKGKFLGVVLDVFKEEPLPVENKLWGYPNVIVTPHISYMSEYRNELLFAEVKENIKRFIQNKELKNKVNIKDGY